MDPGIKKPDNFYLFVGTYTEGQPDSGIYIYAFDPAAFQLKKIVTGNQIINPSFLTVSEDGHFIYACTESKMKNAGSVSCFYFNEKKAELTFLNKQSSMGENPVYVSLYKNSKWLVNANYTGGTVSVYPIGEDGKLLPATQTISYKGSSINKERQESPHIHATVFSPDFKFLFVTDLGTDKIRTYKIAASEKKPLVPNTPADVNSIPGSGPRHFTFHPNGKFCYAIEELSETVAAYSYDQGKLQPVQRISTRDSLPHISHGSADIHISSDGKFLYASNRGDKNTLTIYSIQKDGSLVLKGYQPTLGDHPRNFAIDPTGNFLFVANTGSNTIIVFKRDQETGLLSETGMLINVPGPSCLVFRKM
jgi:6-phosphogluconolactonase (cycloisomerase 2 family)